MDGIYWLVIAVTFVAVIAIVWIGMLFVRKALHSFGEKNAESFYTVLAVQKNYDKIRKKTRIPCSILYVKVGRAAEAEEGESFSAAYRHFEETLLTTFGNKENMAARFGNGDFVILTKLGETKITLAIRQVMREMLLFSKQQTKVLRISVQFGAYLIPASSISFEKAVARAQLACREAEKNKTGYWAWDYNLQKDYESKTILKESLQDGIEQNNFFLEFQPVIDIATGQIAGAEVLSRLSKDRKVIAPADFVPVIQGQNMSADFDFFILEKACQWTAAHREVCEKLRYISVNFARTTIAREEFAQSLLQKIEQYDLPPKCLAVEVLEDKSDEFCDTNVLRENLEKLRQQNITVLLDDFGEGYTSFDDLQNYPINMIKISRTMVNNLNTKIGVRIFESIMNIAKNIGVSVVCEGVETPQQIEILREGDCRYVQGFYFYRPMSSEQFIRAIQNNDINEGVGKNEG